MKQTANQTPIRAATAGLRNREEKSSSRGTGDTLMAALPGYGGTAAIVM